MSDHESSFPESTESFDRVSARAVRALEYEEKAGLGYRRRLARPMGDPFSEPERYQIDREHTAADTWGGFLSAAGAIFGGIALVYYPLLFGFLAVVLATAGTAASSEGARIARIGLVIASIGFFVGMIFAIVNERPVFL